MRATRTLAMLIPLFLAVGPSAAQVSEQTACPSLGADLRCISFVTTGSFQSFSFRIEQGDISFLFNARAEYERDNVTIWEVIGPGGPLYQHWPIDNFQNEGFVDNLTDVREVTVYLPTAERFALAEGLYTIIVSTDLGSRISDAVVLVRSGSVSAVQAIDINVLVMIDGLDSTIESKARNGIETEINNIFFGHSMIVGTIDFEYGTQVEIEKYHRTMDLEDFSGHYRSLCDIANQRFGRDRALNVVRVDYIKGEFTDGIATLMGSPLVEGSTASCVPSALRDDTDFSENDQGKTILS